MDIAALANPCLSGLHTYEPGKPIEETARELGLDPATIIKLASNENPLGPSPMAREALQQGIARAHIYPDGAGHRLREALAKKFHLEPANVVLGNGSNEIIELLCHAFLNPHTNLVSSRHTFSVYELIGTSYGARFIEVPDRDFTYNLDALADAITSETRLVFIANPNNPTGTTVDQTAIDRFMDRLPEQVVACFDEAYHEFFEGAPDTLRYLRAGRHVCILRTFSKIHGLAGLRAGYGLAPAPLANLLQKVRQPFNMNQMAQDAALAALADTAHIRRSLVTNREGLAFWEKAFTERGLRFLPSKANFILVEVGDGDALFREMLRRGVIIRAMRSYQLPSWVRITPGTSAQNHRALEVMDEALATLPAAPAASPAT